MAEVVDEVPGGNELGPLRNRKVTKKLESTVPHAVLLLRHGAAVQRGQLHQAVQSVVSQLGVVSYL